MLDTVLTHCAFMIFLYFVDGATSVTTVLPKNNVTVCLPTPSVMVWEQEQFPNPQTDLSKDYCGRGCKASWICDPGKTLTIEQGDTLDQQIDKIRLSGLCNCPSCETGNDEINIGIAVAPKIKVDDGTNTRNLATAAKVFANYLRTSWSFGRCENDAVILIAEDQKLVQIVIGNTTQNVLEQTCLQLIQEQGAQQLSEGGTAATLSWIVERLRQVFTFRTCEPPELSEPDSMIEKTVIIVFSVVGFLVLVAFIYMCCLRNRYCKKEQRYEIEPPTITLTVPEPHHHHNHHHHHHDNDEHEHDEDRHSSHLDDETAPINPKYHDQTPEA